jgi:hypothetical protein
MTTNKYWVQYSFSTPNSNGSGSLVEEAPEMTLETIEGIRERARSAVLVSYSPPAVITINFIQKLDK